MVLFPNIHQPTEETELGIRYGHDSGPLAAIMQTDGYQKQTQTAEIAEL